MHLCELEACEWEVMYLCELEASLVCAVNSRTARAAQRDPVSRTNKYTHTPDCFGREIVKSAQRWLCGMAITNTSYVGLQWKRTNGAERKKPMYSLDRNRTLGSLMSQLRLVLKETVIVKENKAMKERPPALHWTVRRLISGKLHPAKTPACERRKPKSCLPIDNCFNPEETATVQ